MRIAGVGTALPPHAYDQAELIAAFKRVWGRRHHNTERVEALHRAVMVERRHLVLPMEDYATLQGMKATTDAFIEAGTLLAEKALRAALDAAGMAPREVDAIYLTTVTGVCSPSIDARLVNRMGMRADVKRIPIFGLGCVAGAAGVSRLFDYMRGWPEHAAALICLELCSLTLQKDDLSVANLVSSGLFGDGAAAVVGRGVRGGGPRVVATRSVFYPDTERVMGWEVQDSGFQVLLAPTIPDLVRANVPANVDDFLRDHGVKRSDIDLWVCHPGGPKILEAFQEALGLTRDDLAVTWDCLRAHGNLSSASVLFVLHETLRRKSPSPGARGLMMAMGPGFCAELVLLEW
ncbi:MAG: type III polyketide synthase [Armatimonadetes bacterium]|nr:type III polyketide synthase [Armatimonadota bacterium]